MEQNTNVPAFPTPLHNIKNDGMTLRDYFAAMALQGMFANSNTIIAGLFHEDNFKAAYEAADRMLEARKA